MIPLIPKDEFLNKYNIPADIYDRTGYSWEDLTDIYADYQQRYDELDRAAAPLFNTLIKIDKVHSVRYRIKDPEHVIEKIIRKKAERPNRLITKENYYKEFTDLIGLRAIHLFKDEWITIHKAVTDKWHQKEKPTYYYRAGDRIATKEEYNKIGCKPALHRRHYRSVHYIIKTNPTKQEYFAEIQVRTLFEEGWSEIDHKVGYPYSADDPALNDFLGILNRLAGSADEMATFIKNLKPLMAQSKQDETEIIRKAEEVKSEINNNETLSSEDKEQLSRQVDSIGRSDPFAALRDLFATNNTARILGAPALNGSIASFIEAEAAAQKRFRENLHVLFPSIPQQPPRNDKKEEGK